ncbi:MAG: M15 family metallopeptidase [Clostridiales Family XIII bacterium]|jgi:D-alanyl-D-alanine carboxypeptidase|nr:M15 family metallopeptidase [Clostridiales Family XIII bacterium]
MEKYNMDFSNSLIIRHTRRMQQKRRKRMFALLLIVLIAGAAVFFAVKLSGAPGAPNGGGGPENSPSVAAEDKEDEPTAAQEENSSPTALTLAPQTGDASKTAEEQGEPAASDEDPIWQSADHFYENPVPVTSPSALDVLVNKNHNLDRNYVPPELVTLSSVKVRAEVAEKYKEMAAAAEKEGIRFIPQSGYRSYDYQNTLYTNYKATDPKGADTYSARPGFSEHQTGLAIDLNIPSGGSLRNFTGTPQAEWVGENAHLYGFIIRYTEENTKITGYISEPWHIRYIGVEHATKMKEKNISSFEEYKAKYID